MPGVEFDLRDAAKANFYSARRFDFGARNNDRAADELAARIRAAAAAAGRTGARVENNAQRHPDSRRVRHGDARRWRSRATNDIEERRKHAASIGGRRLRRLNVLRRPPR